MVYKSVKYKCRNLTLLAPDVVVMYQVWYVRVISDGSCRIQFRTLHINACISLWTVRNCILQLPSEITGTYHIIYSTGQLFRMEVGCSIQILMEWPATSV